MRICDVKLKLTLNEMKKDNALNNRILKARAKGLSYRAIAKKENRALVTIYERHLKLIQGGPKELNEKGRK